MQLGCQLIRTENNGRNRKSALRTTRACSSRVQLTRTSFPPLTMTWWNNPSFGFSRSRLPPSERAIGLSVMRLSLRWSKTTGLDMLDFSLSWLCSISGSVHAVLKTASEWGLLAAIVLSNLVASWITPRRAPCADRKTVCAVERQIYHLGVLGPVLVFTVKPKARQASNTPLTWRMSAGVDPSQWPGTMHCRCGCLSPTRKRAVSQSSCRLCH